jgi:hypothetical protein
MEDDDDDVERLDCGHYERLSEAQATPGGFLICSECWQKVLLAQEPARVRTSGQNWLDLLLSLLFRTST